MAVVICGIIGTSLAVYMGNQGTQAFAKQIIDTCKDNMHCSVTGLDNLAKNQNQQVVLGTFSDLVSLYDVSPYPCHETAHHLGMWLYGYTQDLQKSLSYAKMLCGGAIFHGILEDYFMTQQLHNVGASQIDITSICATDPANPYSIIRWQCLHGIGHGLSAYYHNVTAAVNRCDEFKPGWEQLSCSKGVFMQNVVTYYETGQGDFDKNDIFFPCDKVSAKYAPACYHYHASYILKQDKFNVAATFDDCDKITPGTFVKACYHGLGRHLEPVAAKSVRQAISLCTVGKQSNYHIDCLQGMVMTVVNIDTNTDNGFKFCSILEEGFKAGCFDSMGQWVKMLYPTQQERQRECAKAGDLNYIAECMNANLDNVDLL